MIWNLTFEMVLQNKLKIYTYKSKYNLKRKNQVVLLILTDGKKNGITLQ